MNRLIRIIVFSISLIIILLIDLIINPFWPIWGEHYEKEYNGGYITNQPSNLSSFLNDNHYSFFQRFCAVFSLISIYLATILLIVTLLTFLIKKKDIIVANYALLFLLITPTVLLPFTCRFSEMPFIVYCFLPLIVVVLLGIQTIVTKMKLRELKE